MYAFNKVSNIQLLKDYASIKVPEDQRLYRRSIEKVEELLESP